VHHYSLELDKDKIIIHVQLSTAKLTYNAENYNSKKGSNSS